MHYDVYVIYYKQVIMMETHYCYDAKYTGGVGHDLYVHLFLQDFNIQHISQSHIEGDNE